MNEHIDLPPTWFTNERLLEMWGYVKWFMAYNMPIFMICVAALVAFIVLTILIEIPLSAKRNDRKQDDDDDLEVKYY